MRGRVVVFISLTAAAAFSASAAAAASKEYVLKHPKREHCKVGYAKRTKNVRRRVHGHTVTVRETVCASTAPPKPHPTPTTTSSKLEECTAIVSGSGFNPETHLGAFQVILGCYKGEFSSFQVSTNREIVAGSVTASAGSEGKYTCATTSSTSFSCSGFSRQIPSGGEGAAIRAFFKSTQRACEGGMPESATITTQGQTFVAKLGEAGETC